MYSKANFEFPSLDKNQFVSVESNISTNVGHVYPLYFGTHFQLEVSRIGFQNQKNSNSIIVGTLVYLFVTEPAKMGCLKEMFSCIGDDNTSNIITGADSRDNHEKASELIECALSLRLCLFSDLGLSRGKGSACDIDNAGLSNSQERAHLNDLIHAKNKKFSFFPVDTTNDPFGFSISSGNFEGEVHSAEAAVWKRKFPSNNNVGDGQFSRQSEPTSNRFSGTMRWPGL